MRLPRVAAVAAASALLAVPLAVPAHAQDQPPTSRLGLTYNQDCPVDDTNTWRIRPVEVTAPVAWELTNAPGTFNGTLNPGDGEFVVQAPRQLPITATLRYDSDGNGSLDKKETKASGPDLSPEKNPDAFVPGGKCNPEPTPTPEPNPTPTPTPTPTDQPTPTDEAVPTDVPAGRGPTGDGSSVNLAALAAVAALGAGGAALVARALRRGREPLH